MKKSKNNTWKRIAAGALSVALVAGALPANVGGLLTGGDGIVAHATPEVSENWVLTMAEDNDIMDGEDHVGYSAISNAENNVITFSDFEGHLRSGGTDGHESGRPDGYCWVGVWAEVPADVIAVMDGDEEVTIPNDRKISQWFGFNADSVINALQNTETPGVITRTWNLKVKKTVDGDYVDAPVTVNINVNNITILPKDQNNSIENVLFKNTPVFQVVDGEITQDYTNSRTYMSGEIYAGKVLDPGDIIILPNNANDDYYIEEEGVEATNLMLVYGEENGSLVFINSDGDTVEEYDLDDDSIGTLVCTYYNYGNNNHDGDFYSWNFAANKNHALGDIDLDELNNGDTIDGEISVSVEYYTNDNIYRLNLSPGCTRAYTIVDDTATTYNFGDPIYGSEAESITVTREKAALQPGYDFAAPEAAIGLSYDGTAKNLIGVAGMINPAREAEGVTLGNENTDATAEFKYAVLDKDELATAMQAYLNSRYLGDNELIGALLDTFEPFITGKKTLEELDLSPDDKAVANDAFDYIIAEYPATSTSETDAGDYYVFGKLDVDDDAEDFYYADSAAFYIGKATIAKANLAQTDYIAPVGGDVNFTGEQVALIADANKGSVALIDPQDESKGAKGTLEYRNGAWIEGNNVSPTTTLAVGDIIKPTGTDGITLNFGNKSLVISDDEHQLHSFFDSVVVNFDNTSGEIRVARGTDVAKFSITERDAIKITGVNGDTLSAEFVNTATLSEDEWSTTVPTAVDEGDYAVAWRIKGSANYNDVAPQTVSATIKKAEVNFTLVNLADAVVVPVDEQETLNFENNVYTLIGTKKYKIYTNKTIANRVVRTESNTKLFTELKFSTENDAEYNNNTYGYCYTITVPALPLENGYVLSHTNNFEGDNPDAAKSKLYVSEDNEAGELVAELKGKGTYYYGDKPSLDDVEFTQAGAAYKGSIVQVNDIYFMKDGSIVKNDALQVGVTYEMTAYVTVDKSGAVEIDPETGKEINDKSAYYLKRDVTLAERPLYLCDAYLVDEGKDFENAEFNAEQPESATNKKYNATKLDVVQDTDETGAPIVGKYHVEVPAGTFTYDGKEKAPVIKLVNPGNGDILTAKNFAVKEGNTGFKGTNAGSYTFGLEALPSTEATADTEAFVNNYVEELTVNWQIKKAVVNADAIDAKAIDNIVYDAEKLKTADDFTFAAKMTEGENPQPVDPKAAALLADPATAISEPTFGYTPDYTETLGAAAAGISMQQSNYDWAMDDGDEATAAGALNIIETEILPLIANKYIGGGWGFLQQSSEYFKYKISYNGAEEFAPYQIFTEGTELKYLASEDDVEPIVLATLEDGEFFQLTSATLDSDGEVATIHYAITKTVPTTDGKSAGLHKATFTITNPNYEDITIKDVDALIAKRKVTITPSKDNNRTYGYEDVLPSYDNDVYNPGRVLQNELKGDFEIAKTKTDGDKTVLVGKTGLIESDAAQLDMNTEQALQAMAPAVTMFLTIGKEKDTTNKLNPGSNDMFNFETFVNDAGTYEYVIRTPEDINAQLDAWEQAIGGDAQQIAYCEEIRRLINTITANYEYVLPEDSVFTLEKAPLTKDLFTLDEEAQEVLEFELVNGIPTYVFNGSEFLAPEYIADDTTFGDTETKKLNEWDYIKGGYTKAALPGDYYKVEFLATPDGNYKNADADQPWVIEANDGYSASVYVRSNKTYDGKAVTPTMTYYFDGRRISGNDVPKSFKTTYTYYKNTKTDNDGVFLGEDYISYIKANMTKLDEAPKDAGDYYVIATTTAKGYEIEDSYAHFHINRVRVHVTPSVTSKQFGEADPKITFTTDLEKQVVAGDTVNFKKEVTELVIGGYTDETKITEENPTGLVEYDGSVSDKWTYDLNGLELDNPNYTFSLSTENFTVTAHELTDENIRAKKICVAEENGFADPNNNIEVFITVGGEDKILTPGTDYEFTSNVQTQENGSYKVQIKGIGNYAGFAEADVDVIGDISNLEAEDISKLYTITEAAPEVAINGTRHLIGAQVRWNGKVVQDGLTVEEYGIIFSRDGSVTDISELTYEASSTDTTKSIVRLEGNNGRNIVDYGKGVIAVGYAKLKDAAGNELIAYSKNIGCNTYVCTEFAPEAKTNGTLKGVQVRYKGEIYDTKNYSVKEYGLIYSKAAGRTAADLTLEAVDANDDINMIVGANGQIFTDEGNGVVAVGYMIIQNKAGDTAYVYTNDLGGKYDELVQQ